MYLEPTEADDRLGEETPAATVRQHGQRFSPGFLVVSPGQTVVFSNDDEVYHRVFSYSKPNAFDLRVLTRGESQEIVLENPGVVHIYCGLHPAESGTIYVSPSPWFATAGDAGEFTISDVPPGEYRLRTWSEAGHSAARDVTVHAGASSSIDVALTSR